MANVARMGTVRLLVATLLSALTVLKCMRLVTRNAPFTWMRKLFRDLG